MTQAMIGQKDFIIPFDNTVDGVFRTTYEGKIIAVNEGLVKMLGYDSREELMRIDLARDLYVDPSMRREIIEDPSVGLRTVELTWKRRDGKPIEVRTFGRRVVDDAGKLLYFESVVWDITASTIAANLLKIQCDLAVKLSGTCDLHTTLNEVLRAAMQIEGIDSAGVYLLNDASGVFELAASRGAPPWFVEAVSRYSLDTPRAQTLLQGSPLYLVSEDVQHPIRIALEKEGIKIVAIIPIVNQGRVIGTLHLCSHVQKKISLTARQALESIARQIGASVAQAQVETALHQSQQNLQALFDSLQDMVFVLDASGRLLHTNPMVGKRLGYSAAELANMKVGDLHQPQRYQEVLDVFSQIIAGQTSLCEVPLLTKEGVQIPVETLVTLGKWAGLDAVFGVSRDLTEHHRARQALHESESRFRAIFESAAIALVLSNLEGIILEVNGALTEMLGYTPGEIIGKCHANFTLPDDVDSVTSIMKELIDGKHSRVLFEMRFLHKDGNIVWSRLHTSLLRDVNGVPCYIICILENITAQKKAAEAIQKEQQLLRRIIDIHEHDRQLTAYEIHDGIAQQITASLFQLEAFRRQRATDTNAAEKSLEIASRLISQSVDDTRRLISGLRPLILDEYGIIEAIKYLVCEYGKNSGIAIAFQHDVHFQRLVPPLESAIFRIIQEAISNACRYSQSTDVSVELVERDGRLQIKIADQGVGFDPNAIEEKSFGLQSIRERARLLGGHAEIQSAPGSGTCITVELPIVLQAEAARAFNDINYLP